MGSEIENSNNSIKINDNEWLRLQLYLKELERITLEARNYVLELHMKYKVDMNEYLLDNRTGVFVKKQEGNK